MIKRLVMRPTPLIAVSVASLLAWTSTSAQEPAEAEAVSAPEVDDSAAFNAMGYAMASQLRLNIGFSDDELEQILGGMRNAANNGEASRKTSRKPLPGPSKSTWPACRSSSRRNRSVPRLIAEGE
jgi:hypothetical protein